MFRIIALPSTSPLQCVTTARSNDPGTPTTLIQSTLAQYPLLSDPFSGIVGHSETIQRFKNTVDTFLTHYHDLITCCINYAGDSAKGIPIQDLPSSLFKRLPPLSSLLVLHGDYGDGKTSLMLALCEYLKTQRERLGLQQRYVMVIREGQKDAYYLSTREQIDRVLADREKLKTQRERKGKALAGGVLMTLGYIMANYAYFAAKLIPSADRMVVCQDMDLDSLPDPIRYATLGQNMMGPHEYVSDETLYRDKPLFTMAFNYSYACQLFNDLLLACQGFVLLWLLGNVDKHRHDDTPSIFSCEGVPVVVGDLSFHELSGWEDPNAAVPSQRLMLGKAASSFGNPVICENLDQLSTHQQSMLLNHMTNNYFQLPGSTLRLPFSMLILGTTNHPEAIHPLLSRSKMVTMLQHPSIFPDPGNNHTFRLMQLIHHKSQSGDLPRLTDGAWRVLLEHITVATDSIRVNRRLWMALSSANQQGVILDGPRLESALRCVDHSTQSHQEMIDGICHAYWNRLQKLSQWVSASPEGCWVDEIQPAMIQPIPALMIVSDDPSEMTRIEALITKKLDELKQAENLSMGLVAFPHEGGVRLKLMTAEQCHHMNKTLQSKKNALAVLTHTGKLLIGAYSLFFLLIEAYKGHVVNDLITSHDTCLIPGVSASDTAIIKSLKQFDSFHSLIYLFKVMLIALSNWMSTLAIAKTLHDANQWVTAKDDQTPVVLVVPADSLGIRPMITNMTRQEREGQWRQNPLMPPTQRLKIGENTLSWGSLLIDPHFGSATKEEQMRIASMITERSVPTVCGHGPFLGTFVLGVSTTQYSALLEILTKSGRFQILTIDTDGQTGVNSNGLGDIEVSSGPELRRHSPQPH
ncbi:hypothetical protein EBZ35_01130 [bacterium]|nr:hypothetical protein [bacterium]